MTSCLRFILPTKILALSLIFLALSGCEDGDLTMINKVRIFSSRWSLINEEFSGLKRNLQILDSRLEQDFQEVEGMLDEIPDSLRGRKYKVMLADYQALIEQRDSIKDIYVDTKNAYTTTREGYNAWEMEVMEGQVNREIAFDKLEGYAEYHRQVNQKVDSLQEVVDDIVLRHNTIMSNLVDLMGTYTNYDIHLF